MKNSKSTTPLVNSVLHATKILELYAAQKEEYLSLAQISSALAMHKTTVFRILRTLQSVGWIEQSAESRNYRLGNSIHLVASAVSVHQTYRNIIYNEMQKLSAQFNETVILSAITDKTGICIDLVKTKHRLALATESGYIVPLDAGATGKVLLAAQSLKKQKEILAQYNTRKQQTLKNQLELIASQGYAFSESEVEIGVAALAVPLPLEDAAYVLSISGPSVRLKQLNYKLLLHALQNSVLNIQRKCANLA
ncbi:MAG: IclR family transcriptional regulator [Acidaminococcaceae bacterium]|jgi:DNA-binding IclR family transcriptional regulator|nr:IclR family transcriptional regulator [Acidaminococcaceae bacterium]MCI2110094.1 IclR family transcriptional regulator [Acidaminococcaceae bacterium]